MSTPVAAEPSGSSPLPVAYWDEDTICHFRGSHYRIVTRLGSGGVGVTFKVMEVDPAGLRELSGPYVAKVITNAEIGQAAARSYARVRAQTGGSHLAGVLEVAQEWQPDTITALLQWVEGDPLDYWKGTLPLYLEEHGEPDVEKGLLRWIQDLCKGLAQLHRAGLVHGDVSPKNIIVYGPSIVLTDYDLSTTAGSTPLGGTLLYCAPDVERRAAITPSDDIFALAASFFHVLFERSPFEFPTGLDKSRGLNWTGLDRDTRPRLARFLDKATNPQAVERFRDADDALDFLTGLLEPQPTPPQRPPALEASEEPWLKQLLLSYPASPHGNTETRGLDTDFARQTYVETKLDQVLADDIRARRVSLVILCGNAGDGKTALLQRLATKLGLDPGHSSQRLWDETLPDGLRLRVNLDGSAAYQGRPARALLDEFFAPFMDGNFPADLVHLLAINDGPLLAWLEDRDEDTPLTAELRTLLQEESAWSGADGRIRFIDLNSRSLVGGIQPDQGAITTEFLDGLIDRMLGSEDPRWNSCPTCSAKDRCSAWRSVQTLRDPERGPVVRQRLARALQAVHHRGEVHITARGLRAALGYILFGTHYCTDLHSDPSLRPPHYWDRAFKGSTDGRQGELLAELSELDPGLDSHPLLDRVLLRNATTSAASVRPDPELLRSLRRQAYFEWTDEDFRRVTGDAQPIDLRGATHLDTFQRVAIGTEAEIVETRDRICEGIARLEDLPPQAFSPHGWPVRITPRTPTETSFWVRKPRDRFHLRPHLPHAAPGLDVLHTHVILTYRFAAGAEQHEESLLINATLFELLLEIGTGYQLSDARSDDLFANLAIFKQRLAHEDEHTLYAWNPLDDRVFRIDAQMADGVRKLVLTPEEGG